MPTENHESRPIPEIAKVAFALADANHARLTNELALSTLEAMGLSQKNGWRVYPLEGIAIHEEPSAR